MTADPLALLDFDSPLADTWISPAEPGVRCERADCTEPAFIRLDLYPRRGRIQHATTRVCERHERALLDSLGHITYRSTST